MKAKSSAFNLANNGAIVVIKNESGQIVAVGRQDSEGRILETIAESAPERCPYCDNSGDVHRADGEWLGKCTNCNPEQMITKEDVEPFVELACRFKNDEYESVDDLYEPMCAALKSFIFRK